MPHFLHDGFDFHYIDRGTGVPFVFQHGLGGSTEQSAELFPMVENSRLIALDCRDHGLTQPACSGDRLGFAVYSRDVQALLDHLAVGRAWFGGISMGAGVAVRIALDNPERVSGLLLVRPAWLDGPMPAHAWYATVARLMREHGPHGREMLAALPEFAVLRKASPNAADGLLRQFDTPQAKEYVARLEALPLDTPIPERSMLRSLSMPALVIGTDDDPIHPLELARMLAAELRNATFQQITSKSINVASYSAELHSAITSFTTARPKLISSPGSSRTPRTPRCTS